MANFQVQISIVCLHCDMFPCFNVPKSSLFFSYCLCCSTSFHPLSETRAQSALIGHLVSYVVIGFRN